MKRIHLFIISVLLTVIAAKGQNTVGVSGLINVPSAEMNTEGDARIGANYLNSHQLPEGGFRHNGERYNTADFYLNVTPLSWAEVAYTFTLMRAEGTGKYTDKDRQFSVKLNPLREGKWYPAIAIGCNDVEGAIRADMKNEDVKTNDFFSYYYVATTKHFNVCNGSIGVNVVYRHCPNQHNKRWEGFVGGLTYTPYFAKNIRGIVEYTGDEVNIGADCLLWKHLFLQGVLTDGKYFSGGICFQTNLF